MSIALLLIKKYLLILLQKLIEKQKSEYLCATLVKQFRKTLKNILSKKGRAPRMTREPPPNGMFDWGCTLCTRRFLVVF